MRDVPTLFEKSAPSRAERLATHKRGTAGRLSPVHWAAILTLVAGLLAAIAQDHAPAYMKPAVDLTNPGSREMGFADDR